LDLVNDIRPSRLSEVVGNTKLISGLERALGGGSLATRILLSGQTGCGKTTLARLIGAGVNCLQTDRPCGTCEQCKSVLSPNSFDYELIDSAAVGVNEVRDMWRNKWPIYPMFLRTRVVVFDEAQKITPAAQQQLLKALDELPRIQFIFCTTDPEKIDKALRNRCVHLRLSSLQPKESEELIERALKATGKTVGEDTKTVIIQESQGCPRTILLSLQSALTGLQDQKEEVGKRASTLFATGKLTMADIRGLKQSPDEIRRDMINYGYRVSNRVILENFLPVLSYDLPYPDLLLRFMRVMTRE